MAMIENVTLTIDENQSPAVATVRYRIRPSQMDVWTQQRYFEQIELIGVDAPPKEDGQNELIQGSRRGIGQFVALDMALVSRAEPIRLTSNMLDEDPDLVFPEADEIAARVTLFTDRPGPATGTSSVVIRGGFVEPPFV